MFLDIILQRTETDRITSNGNDQVKRTLFILNEALCIHILHAVDLYRQNQSNDSIVLNALFPTNIADL